MTFPEAIAVAVPEVGDAELEVHLRCFEGELGSHHPVEDGTLLPVLVSSSIQRDVHVRVHEARCDEFPGAVDHVGACRDLDLRARSDAGDAVALDDDGGIGQWGAAVPIDEGCTDDRGRLAQERFAARDEESEGGQRRGDGESATGGAEHAGPPRFSGACVA